MKPKPKFLLIKSTVYPFDVLVTTATTEETIKYIETTKHYKMDDEEKEKLGMSGDGRTIQLHGGQVVIRLNKVKTSLGIDIATLAHEIFHAVNFIFERIGIKLSNDNDECYAYFIGYLMRETLSFYEKK